MDKPVMDCTEFGWRWAILPGAAVRYGLPAPVCGEPMIAELVAGELSAFNVDTKSRT